jgi:integrase
MNALRESLEEYLTFRRKLGFKLTYPAHALSAFVAFLETRQATYITQGLALEWALDTRTEKAIQQRARRLQIVRGFARYAVVTDPRTEIPPDGLLPGKCQRSAPYIYSQAQLLRLIEDAATLPPQDGLRPFSYSTVFGLLAVTGMRVGEVVALDRGDVDLDGAVLTVRAGKFGKTRFIPVHASTVARLHAYARRRDRLCPRPATASFFLSGRGQPLTTCGVRWTFVRVSRRIGLRAATDSNGPRLHDLRHTFAVRTLINWYRAGLAVDAWIPKLSTYLGHVKVTDTYWYLSAVPELLCLANARLARFLEEQP